MYSDYKYKDDFFGSPRHDVDPKLKNEPLWNKEFAEYIYSSEMQNKSVTFCGKRDKIRELRKYSNSEQDITKYQDLMIGKLKQGETKRKGYANLNFEILSLAPKFKRIVLGIVEGIDFDISADAMDETSGVERETIKWNLWAKKEFKSLYEKASEVIGMSFQKEDYLPENLEQLELFDKMGGFKLKTEIGIENGFLHTDNISDKDEVRKRNFTDLYVLNVAAIRDFVDFQTQEVKYKYLDPDKLIVIGGEEDPNFKNASAYGYLTYYSIAEILKVTNLTEPEVRDIAERFSGKFGNPDDNIYYDDDQNKYAYDDWVVPVLDCEMETVDNYYKTKRKDKHGEGYKIYPEQYGKVYNNANKKTEVADIKVWRRCKWIIGTEKVFDYGLQYDMPRPKPSDALSSFHVYKIDGKSIQEQIMQLLDSLQLTWIRYQNLKATGKLSGISVEFSTLQNMSLGGKKLSPIEALKVYTQTNVLLYKANAQGSSYYSPNSGSPVNVLPSGFPQDLAAIVSSFKTDIDLINEITGINDVVAASSPNPNVGLGQSKLAIGAANNNLKEIITARKQLYKATAINCALRLQVVAKGSKGDTIYNNILGKGIWKALKISSKRPFTSYGINISPKIDVESREKIELRLETGIQSGKNGKAALTMSEYFAISRMLSSGTSMKNIGVYMANKERQRDQRDAKLQQDNIKIGAQNNERLNAQKSKSEIEKENAKVNNDIKKIETEGKETRLTNKELHNQKMLEIRETNSLKTENVN